MSAPLTSYRLPGRLSRIQPHSYRRTLSAAGRVVVGIVIVLMVGLPLTLALAWVSIIPPARVAAYDIATGDYPWADAGSVPIPPATDLYSWGYIDKAECDKRSDSYDCDGFKRGAYYTRDQWKYDLRNCTSYLAWRLAMEYNNLNASGLGSGRDWNTTARTRGWTVDVTPEVGDIAQWVSGGDGFGHVAFVEAVNADGTVFIAEYNHDQKGTFGYRDKVRAENYIDVNGPNPSGFTLKVGSANTGSTFPLPPATPTLLRRSSGETDIVAIAPDKHLDFYVRAPGSAIWGSLPIPESYAEATPAVIQRPNGETDIAVQGPDNKLDFYVNAYGSAPWGRIPITTASGTTYHDTNPPAMIQRSTGETDVIVKGPNNQADFYYNFPGQFVWNRDPVAVPGYALRAPVLTQRPDIGETNALIVGKNNSLDFYTNQEGSRYWGMVGVGGVVW